MTKLLFILLLLLSWVPSYAIEQIEARSGDFIYLKIDLTESISLDSLSKISAILNVKHRTILNPESFCDKDSSDISTRIQTHDRNTYQIETSVDSLLTVSDYIYLKCRVLAGAETSTKIDLNNIKILGQSLAAQQYMLNIKYQNVPLLYIRYFNFANIYPSPIYPGQEIICEFTLDRESEVEFILVDLNGKYFRLDKRTFAKGDIKHHLPTSKSMAAGPYRLRIITNHGEVSKKLMVIR